MRELEKLEKNHHGLKKLYLIIGFVLVLINLVYSVSSQGLCNNNLDCDDSDLYTFDKCINPGSDLSYCDYSPIKCVNNNDCGFTGFFGDEFCSQNDVFKLFQEAICKNPGTTQSECSVVNNSKMVVDCGNNFCENFSGNYCSGNKVYHSRWCFSKGCSEGFCYNNQNLEEQLVKNCSSGCSNGKCDNEPMCFKDSDCKPEIISAKEFFCKEEDVYENQRIDKCNNPGLDSFCSTFFDEVFVKKCFNGCLNGACVDDEDEDICTKNSDCGKSKTTYRCEGKKVIKEIEKPICSESICKSESDEEVLRVCENDCRRGACVNEARNRDKIEEDNSYYEQLIHPVKKDKALDEVFDYKPVNDTIVIKNSNLQILINESFFGIDYFWVIFFLALVFIILIIILVLVLRR